MQERYYPATIGQLTRHLPICQITDTLAIAVFNMLGDVEVTIEAARALLAMAPDFDVLLTAEAKSIPLIYEMAKQAGHKYYAIARKSEKNYAKTHYAIDVESITTAGKQRLFLSEDDAALLKSKRVLLIDDVISTGHTLTALEQLVQLTGAKLAGSMAVFAEGEAALREDIISLGTLPLFSPT